MQKGSDYYTAPEIVSDFRSASAQSDIYSIGCILHDMLGQKNRIPCSEINESGEFGGIIQICTRRDPKRRFPSVSALRDALISIDYAQLQPAGKKAVELAAALDQKEPLSEKIWNDLVSYVGGTIDQDIKITLLKIGADKIDEVIGNYPELARRLALIYAAWIRDGTFNFDDCDGLANRIEKFYAWGDIDIKAECTMALLYMGTSHNRWYVERKFIRMADPTISALLAQRLALEFRVDGTRMCSAVSHCKISIGTGVDSLHPTLQEIVKLICK
jgi:eukaryotic-like serine/threonine-protein kinase